MDFPTFDLNGQVALVTGAARGLGRAISLALAHAGADVALGLRDANAHDNLPAEIAALARRALPLQMDMACLDQVRCAVEEAARHFGRLDILVNNAGIGIMKRVDQLSPEEWDQTIQTNLSSAFYCSREAIPLLRRRAGGYIFNISSLAGANAFPGGAAYNASKSGLNGFSEAMMQDIRYDGIRVSYIMPGSVDTDFGAASGNKPRAPWKLTGEDVAKAIIDLYRFPSRALASRIEMRPAQPPEKK